MEISLGRISHQKISLNINYLLLRFLYALFITLPLPSCKTIQQPEFKYFKELKIAQLGLSESTLTAQLVYFNPNTFGYKIRNFSVDIYLNNRLMGRSTSSQLIKVDKMASFQIPVELKVNMKNLPVNSWNLITQKKVRIAAKGFVMVGVRGIYKEIPVTYEGDQELKIW